MLLSQKSALACKIETTYGVDSVPTAALNAMQVRNLKHRPIVTVRENRDLFTPYLGNSKDLVSAFYGEFSFDFELAGGGGLGTVPPYDPMIRSAGCSVVVEAGVRVIYKPVSTGFDSMTCYGYLDGVLHRITGARASSFRLTYNYQKASMASAAFMGIFVPMIDQPFPGTWDFGSWVDPVPFTHEWHSGFTYYGTTGLVLQNFTVDFGLQTSFRNLINDRGTRITGRAPTGTLDIGAELAAVKNWPNIVRDGTLGALQLFHGNVAGNVLDNYAPQVQVMDFDYGEFQGNVMLNQKLKFMPTSSGNDEFVLTVR